MYEAVFILDCETTEGESAQCPRCAGPAAGPWGRYELFTQILTYMCARDIECAEQISHINQLLIHNLNL